jgi:hypothetical protein
MSEGEYISLGHFEKDGGGGHRLFEEERECL